MNLVFYDGTCGFCDSVVQLILKVDKNKIFVFAPLQGETAKKLLTDLPHDTDSLVLIENYQMSPKTFLYGKAAFRILWLLGFPYSILGSFSFLPSFLYDWMYRIVAKNRQKLFGSCSVVRPDKDRFLS